MNGTLKVTPDKLTSTANTFQSTNRNIKNCTTNMQSVISSLSQWQGDAALTYRNKFKQLQGDMNDMYNIIEQHCNDLIEMAKNYKTAEANIQNAVSNLQTDVIH